MISEPAILYRTFANSKDANNFLDGEIWLRKITHYRTVEDVARRDPRDGMAWADASGGKILIQDKETGRYGSPMELTSAVASISLQKPSQ